MTDIITLFLSFYFLIRGALRGFMNSLMVPFSIIVATIISVIVYQITSNIIITLLIGLLGPFLLCFFLKMLLKIWAKATNNEIRPGFLSRLGGAILTLAWGWFFITCTLILLAVLPPWGKTLTDIHHDVTKSASYFFIKPLGESLFSNAKQIAPAATNTTSTNDAKSLAQDPRFQKILQDPDIQKEIDAHDIVSLMRNPKMIDLTQQLMSDPATMKKIFAIYSAQTQPDQKHPSQEVY